MILSVSFRIIDTHNSNLSILCGICSKTVITGRGYSNAKTVHDYQITLATYLKIDVNEYKDMSLGRDW